MDESVLFALSLTKQPLFYNIQYYIASVCEVTRTILNIEG